MQGMVLFWILSSFTSVLRFYGHIRDFQVIYCNWGVLLSRCLGVSVWLLNFSPFGPLVLWARLCARFPFLPACVVRLVSRFT